MLQMALSPEEKRLKRIDRIHAKFKELTIGKCFNQAGVGVAVLFQKLVRLANANEHGICACVTCDKPGHWKEMEGGHFISRRNKATILDERNCWPQCNYCNQRLNGNAAEYRKFLEAQLGLEQLEGLEALGHTTRQWTKYELAEAKVNILDEIKVHEKRLGEFLD